MPHTILIVAQLPVVRRGFRAIIEDASDLQVTGAVDRTGAALDQLENGDGLPDLVLTEIFLPGRSGITLTKEVLSWAPNQKVLLTSRHDETLCGERALQAGAKGFVHKSESSDVIATAIQQVVTNGHYVPDGLQQHILTRYSSGNSGQAESSLASLTDREWEVFAQMGRGLSMREIAENLHLSINTVQTHRANIKEKMNVESSQKLWHVATLTLAQGPAGPENDV